MQAFPLSARAGPKGDVTEYGFCKTSPRLFGRGGGFLHVIAAADRANGRALASPLSLKSLKFSLAPSVRLWYTDTR